MASGTYVRTTRRGHPVADSNGKVYVHRQVLYDEIGDGPHTCHWCKWDGLNWGINRDDPSGLVPDHLNSKRDDNRAENLVPTHSWCNNNRHTIEQLGIPWSTFENVAPGDRPALYNPGTKAPTKTAFELAEADAATSPKAGSDTGLSSARSPVSDPSPPSLPPIRKGLVRWEDLVR
jgi:hypothetical protein